MEHASHDEPIEPRMAEACMKIGPNTADWQQMLWSNMAASGYSKIISETGEVKYNIPFSFNSKYKFPIGGIGQEIASFLSVVFHYGMPFFHGNQISQDGQDIFRKVTKDIEEFTNGKISLKEVNNTDFLSKLYLLAQENKDIIQVKQRNIDYCHERLGGSFYPGLGNLKIGVPDVNEACRNAQEQTEKELEFIENIYRHLIYHLFGLKDIRVGNNVFEMAHMIASCIPQTSVMPTEYVKCTNEIWQPVYQTVGINPEKGLIDKCSIAESLQAKEPYVSYRILFGANAITFGTNFIISIFNATITGGIGAYCKDKKKSALISNIAQDMLVLYFFDATAVLKKEITSYTINKMKEMIKAKIEAVENDSIIRSQLIKCCNKILDNGALNIVTQCCQLYDISSGDFVLKITSMLSGLIGSCVGHKVAEKCIKCSLNCFQSKSGKQKQ